MEENAKQMQRTGVWRTVFLMLLGLGINYCGKFLAVELQLPLWLDSIGTGVTAGLLGPVFGAMCGLTSNLLYGVSDVTQIVFAITNIAAGTIIRPKAHPNRCAFKMQKTKGIRKRLESLDFPEP